MINLEEEARKRRERLRKQPLARAEEEKEACESAETVADAHSDGDKELDLPPGVFDAEGSEIISVSAGGPLTVTLEAQAQEILAAARLNGTTASFFAKDVEAMDSLLAPRDMNADLKREYEKRNALLAKSTKRAIVDIVRERLESSPRSRGNE